MRSLSRGARRSITADHMLPAEIVPSPPVSKGSYRPNVAGPLPLRRLDTAVTSCAGANGLDSMMLLGTPLKGHSTAAAPLVL
jgi:hypothetical protein